MKWESTEAPSRSALAASAQQQCLARNARAMLEADIPGDLRFDRMPSRATSISDCYALGISANASHTRGDRGATSRSICGACVVCGADR